MILSYLYVLESADYIFLINQTEPKMSWGNLSSHVSKLEDAGYVTVKKEFVGKKPHTMLSLSEKGREEFEKYRLKMKNFLS